MEDRNEMFTIANPHDPLMFSEVVTPEEANKVVECCKWGLYKLMILMLAFATIHVMEGTKLTDLRVFSVICFIFLWHLLASARARYQAALTLYYYKKRKDDL